MSYTRIKNGDSHRLEVRAVDSVGAGVTGATVTLRIRRASDGQYWNGSAFQAGVITVNMTETSAGNEPGLYHYVITPPSNDILSIYGTSVSASIANKPWAAQLETYPLPLSSAETQTAAQAAIVAEEPISAIITGAGAHVVTLTIEAPGGTPQAGAGVTIKNASKTQIIATGTTNASGVIAFSLNADSYKILVTKPTVATWAEADLVVSGTMAQTVIGTLFTISAPSQPNQCAVLVFPSVDAVASALRYIADSNQVIDSVVIDTTPIIASVNDNGADPDYYRADLVRGASYRFESSRIVANDLHFTVPDASSANLADLIKGMREI